MLDLSCLDRPPPPADQLLLSEGLYFTSVMILLLALVGAALAAPLVRKAYRNRIVRLMRFNQIAPRPALWWARRGTAAPGNGAEHVVAGNDRSALRDDVQQRERRLALSTMLAWLVFTLLALPVGHWILADASASDMALFMVGAGLLALGPAVINLPPRFARRGLLAGIAICAIAALFAAGLSEPEPAPTASGEDDDVGLFEMVFGGAIAGFAYFSIFHRRLRGLVLPVFVVVAVAMMLMLIPYGYLEPHLGACWDEANARPQPALPLPLYAFSTMVFALAAWLGLKALAACARLVEARWLSELSMIALIALALIALALIAGVLSEQRAPSPWLAWLALPWTAAAVVTYRLGLGYVAPAAPGPRLLVLRVFARERRQLKLLDTLQSRWRYAGPVYQIGGPDLATTNIDPHECALFLVGRLHDLFLPEAASEAQLGQRLQSRADREGRYGISEVFCFNSAWQHTVEQLMRISDAILLDLRGFNAERRGASYELATLARAGLLERVVAIGDAHSDWTLVERLLQAPGEASRAAPQRFAHRFDGGALSANAIFDALLDVARRSQPLRTRVA